MRFIRLIVGIVLVGTASSAYADPIPTYQVTLATMHMVPNAVGDNITFRFTGPGVEITGEAGMGCLDWCTGQPIPLDTPVVTSQIFLENLNTLTLGAPVSLPSPLSWDLLSSTAPVVWFHPRRSFPEMRPRR